MDFPAPTGEMSVVKVSGEIVGRNLHLLSQGLLQTGLGTATRHHPNQGNESITVDFTGQDETPHA